MEVLFNIKLNHNIFDIFSRIYYVFKINKYRTFKSFKYMQIHL